MKAYDGNAKRTVIQRRGLQLGCSFRFVAIRAKANYLICLQGWVAEWLKAPVLKTGRRASVSRVRIPPHPPIQAITTCFCGILTCLASPNLTSTHNFAWRSGPLSKMALPFENRGGKDYYINWSRIAAMTARLAQPRSPAHALHSLVPCRREGRFCVTSLSSTPVVRAAACDVPASAYAHGEQGHESGRVSERRYGGHDRHHHSRPANPD